MKKKTLMLDDKRKYNHNWTVIIFPYVILIFLDIFEIIIINYII